MLWPLQPERLQGVLTEKGKIIMKRENKKRFYTGKSQIYGITVYDRTTQAPAYEYGATYEMDEMKATFLAIRLNIALRKGKLEDERYDGKVN